jgi:hypothetical protein
MWAAQVGLRLRACRDLRKRARTALLLAITGISLYLFLPSLFAVASSWRVGARRVAVRSPRARLRSGAASRYSRHSWRRPPRCSSSTSRRTCRPGSLAGDHAGVAEGVGVRDAVSCYLGIVNAVPAWTRKRNWTTALLAFKIHFGDRPARSMVCPSATSALTKIASTTAASSGFSGKS